MTLLLTIVLIGLGAILTYNIVKWMTNEENLLDNKNQDEENFKPARWSDSTYRKNYKTNRKKFRDEETSVLGSYVMMDENLYGSVSSPTDYTPNDSSESSFGHGGTFGGGGASGSWDYSSSDSSSSSSDYSSSSSDYSSSDSGSSDSGSSSSDD